MGRKPKSKAAKDLTGNRSNTPNNKDHVTLPMANLKAPTWLDKTGKGLWSKLAPILSSKGLLTEGDIESLATMCQSYSDYREAVQVLRTEGGLYKQVQEH